MKKYKQKITGTYLHDYLTGMGYFSQSYSCEPRLKDTVIDVNKEYECDIEYNFDGFCEYFHLTKIHNLC